MATHLSLARDCHFDGNSFPMVRDSCSVLEGKNAVLESLISKDILVDEIPQPSISNTRKDSGNGLRKNSYQANHLHDHKFILPTLPQPRKTFHEKKVPPSFAWQPTGPDKDDQNRWEYAFAWDNAAAKGEDTEFQELFMHDAEFCCKSESSSIRGNVRRRRDKRRSQNCNIGCTRHCRRNCETACVIV